MRHIKISSLWIQEKQDLHQLEMRKVLGTENPADIMTRYLTRAVMDIPLEYLSQRRESGRALSGLNIQGKNAPSNTDILSTATRGQWRHLLGGQLDGPSQLSPDLARALGRRTLF